ncbi:MAG: hypothetical protein K2P81_05010 [Bacteriovoracaceae bacterium]|nr:hypothetical protein [Bacteriovoracaceae bacterium]
MQSKLNKTSALIKSLLLPGHAMMGPVLIIDIIVIFLYSNVFSLSDLAWQQSEKSNNSNAFGRFFEISIFLLSLYGVYLFQRRRDLKMALANTMRLSLSLYVWQIVGIVIGVSCSFLFIQLTKIDVNIAMINNLCGNMFGTVFLFCNIYLSESFLSKNRGE